MQKDEESVARIVVRVLREAEETHRRGTAEEQIPAQKGVSRCWMDVRAEQIHDTAELMTLADDVALWIQETAVELV